MSQSGWILLLIPSFKWKKRAPKWLNRVLSITWSIDFGLVGNLRIDLCDDNDGHDNRVHFELVQRSHFSRSWHQSVLHAVNQVHHTMSPFRPLLTHHRNHGSTRFFNSLPALKKNTRTRSWFPVKCFQSKYIEIQVQFHQTLLTEHWRRPGIDRTDSLDAT